jgi:hypothetical protein
MCEVQWRRVCTSQALQANMRHIRQMQEAVVNQEVTPQALIQVCAPLAPTSEEAQTARVPLSVSASQSARVSACAGCGVRPSSQLLHMKDQVERIAMQTEIHAVAAVGRLDALSLLEEQAPAAEREPAHGKEEAAAQRRPPTRARSLSDLLKRVFSPRACASGDGAAVRDDTRAEPDQAQPAPVVAAPPGARPGSARPPARTAPDAPVDRERVSRMQQRASAALAAAAAPPPPAALPAAALPPPARSASAAEHAARVAAHRAKIEGYLAQLNEARRELAELRREFDVLLAALGFEAAKNQALQRALWRAGIDPRPILREVAVQFGQVGWGRLDAGAGDGRGVGGA